jgi:hypothetical protein
VASWIRHSSAGCAGNIFQRRRGVAAYHATTVTDPTKLGRQMYGLVERLISLCRSIASNGVRATLEILAESIPLTVLRSGHREDPRHHFGGHFRAGVYSANCPREFMPFWGKE